MNKYISFAVLIGMLIPFCAMIAWGIWNVITLFREKQKEKKEQSDRERIEHLRTLVSDYFSPSSVHNPNAYHIEAMPPEPDRKEKYKEAALEYKALFDAMKDAGFDDNKAFLLTKTLVAKTLDNY